MAQEEHRNKCRYALGFVHYALRIVHSLSEVTSALACGIMDTLLQKQEIASTKANDALSCRTL